MKLQLQRPYSNGCPQHNVSWGACHFLSRVDDMPLDLSCPEASPISGAEAEAGGNGTARDIYEPGLRSYGPRLDTPIHSSSLNGIFLWHAPPKYLKKDEMWWLEDSNRFTVVRDPYSRAVSAYSYITGSQDAEAMNVWLDERLNEIYSSRPTSSDGTDWKPGYFRASSMTLVPQTDYIDENVRVLHLESLEQDFMCMLKDHGLQWEWMSERRNKSKPGHLTVANVTASNLRLIEKVYHRDFLDLGYPLRVQNE